MTSVRRRRARQVYRLLLWLYPARVRVRFADEQVELFERLWEQQEHRQWPARLRFWRRTCTDVVGNAFRLRVQRRRAATRLSLVEMLMQDLTLALRLMRHAPALTTVVCLTLGVGIGANAAIVSVVDTVLFRPLPYHNAQDLVRIWTADRSSGERKLEASYQDFEAFRDQSRTMTSAVAFSRVAGPLLDETSTPVEVVVARVTPDWFHTFGLSPVIGRDFTPDEFASEARPVMLSHDLWVRRYGGAPDVLDQQIRIDGERVRVVGVMPAAFDYPRDADVWRPFTNTETHDDDRELYVIARLAQGETPRSATREVEVIAARLEAAFPEENEHLTAWVEPMHAMLVGDVRRQLWVLIGAVSAVLLIVCANIANLLMARGLARTREFALRVALGAGRRRLVRQLVTEHAVLAMAGGAAGVLVGWGLLPILVTLAPSDTPRLQEVAFDSRVIAIMSGVTALTGLVFGVLPALQFAGRSTRTSSTQALAGGWRHAQRLPRSLVVAEVALSTTLVVVAGVLTISFARGLGFDRGFDPSGLVTVSVDQPNDHADAAAMRAFYEGLATDLSRLPAVAGVAFSSQSPLSAVGLRPPLVVNGQPAPSQRYRAVVHFVSPEYFDVIGMTMRSGRAWTSTGSPDDTRQVVVNEAFVRQFLPDTDPLTTRLEFFRVPFLVGGVVSNLHPDPADAPPAIVYVSHRAFGLPSMTMVLRTTGDTTALLPTLRQLIWNHAPASPLDDLAPVEWRIGEALAAPRFGATLVGGFAALALVLASLGIYGVLAFSVTRRSREIGIRRALGATNASVMGLIARDGLTLVLIGILIGTLGATLVTQAIAHTLIDVGRLDALSFGGGIALMLLVSGLACWIPARAASRFDPVAALRAE